MSPANSDPATQETASAHCHAKNSGYQYSTHEWNDQQIQEHTVYWILKEMVCDHGEGHNLNRQS